MKCVLGLLMVFACGGARPTASTKDDRQAVCPRALDGSSMLEGFAHEISRGCPLPVFVSNDPVCGRANDCTAPCSATLVMGDRKMGPINYRYDASGNMIAMSGGSMSVTCAFEGRRVVQCTDAGGSTVTVKRDAAGRIISVSDGEATWQLTYNEHGDVATVSRPGVYAEDPPMSWTLAYDDKHRLVSEAEGTRRVAYRYDDRGRMVERSEEGGRSPYRETFRYDEADRLIASSSTRKFETTFTYDARGRIVEYSAVNPQNPGATGARYSYDCR